MRRRVRAHRNRRGADRIQRGEVRRNRRGPGRSRRRAVARNRQGVRRILVGELRRREGRLGAVHRHNRPARLVRAAPTAAGQGGHRGPDRNREGARRREARRLELRSRRPFDRGRRCRRAGSRADRVVVRRIRPRQGAAHSHLVRQPPEESRAAGEPSIRRGDSLQPAADRVNRARAPGAPECMAMVLAAWPRWARRLRRAAARRAAKMDQSHRAARRRPSCL